MLFEPFQIKNVRFANRILRSSMGGRTAYYDGTVSPAWVHFEKRFAKGGVAGIISPTISVNEQRQSPLEYPSLHDDRFVGPLRDAVREIKASGPNKDPCRYIVQIGDTGAHTHTSLRSQDADRVSASAVFDFQYGYQNSSRAMTIAEIQQTVREFAEAAHRVVEAGCDGIEVTASKGYLIHQFLNPLTNRRTDHYGGSVDNRFQLLEDIVKAVREAVGPDFLFGVRMSAKDFNCLPPNLRFPLIWPPPPWRDWSGNDLAESTHYARKLEQLGVDYLHIDSGFGFPNPKGSPGSFPEEAIGITQNAYRFLGAKAKARATFFNLFHLLVPAAARKRWYGLFWRFEPAANADFAAAIRRVVGIPVIGNGGFQDLDVIEGALTAKKCDMIAIARPLLANPDLLDQFAHANTPQRPCSFCSLCCASTAVLPLGCYDVRRFESQELMMNQVLAWCSPNAPFCVKDGKKPDKGQNTETMQ